MFTIGPLKMKNTLSTGGRHCRPCPLCPSSWPRPAETVEVIAEHVTLLEGVIDRALVIRTRLLQHIVERATASRGSPGTFAIRGDGEGFVGVLLPLITLVLLALLLALLAPLGIF